MREKCVYADAQAPMRCILCVCADAQGRALMRFICVCADTQGCAPMRGNAYVPMRSDERRCASMCVYADAQGRAPMRR
jgi:hypothetical protein